jgi:single-stranded DNA-binding protein
MWINVEVWDAVAKDNIQLFRKGATLNGLGTLIFNKWIDKSSGEERKQFKHRLLKVISKEEMSIFEDTEFDLKATLPCHPLSQYNRCSQIIVAIVPRN